MDTNAVKKMPSANDINLTKSFKRRLTTDNMKDMYQSVYKKMPLKVSSSNFLAIYILHTIQKTNSPLYGKEILEGISRIFDENVWKPSNGTLYPLIKQMVKEGLLEVAYTDRVNNKKMYDITEKGSRVFGEKKDGLKSMLTGSQKFFKNVYEELYGDE